MHKIIMCILILVLLTYGYAQSNSFQLYEQLPDRTLLLWRLPDIAKSREAMTKTSIHMLWQEPEIQKLFKDLTDPYQGQLEQTLQQVEAVLSIPVSKAVDILHGEFAVALVDVNPRQETVGVALSLEFGENRQEIESLIALLKEQMRIPVAVEKYQDYDISVVKNVVPKMEISFAIIQNTLVVTTQKQLLQELIDGPKGLNKPLKDNENFKEVLAKIHRQGVAVEQVYLNIEESIKRFSFAIPRDIAPMVQQLGGYDLKALGVGVNLCEAYVNVDCYVYSDGKKEGALSLLDLKPISSEVYSKAPQKSNGFTSFHLDILGQLNKVKALLEDVSPDGSFLDMYQQSVQKIERKLGFSVENDLLQIFDTELYSYNYMPTEGLLPRTITSMTLKNQDKFWQFLNLLSEKGHIEVKNMDFAGSKIHYLSLELGNINRPFRSLERMGDLAGLSAMCFVIEDNYLYIGNNVHDLKSFLEERSSWQGLDTNADFQELQKFIPENAALVWYFDARELFNEFWNTFTPILRSFEGIMRKAGIPFDSATLPQATTISRHLKPCVFSYTSDSKGFLASYTSPMTIIVPLAGAIGVGSAIAIPIIEKQKIQGQEEAARYTLRNIYHAQQSYQVDYAHSGTMKELVDNYYVYGIYSDGDGLYSGTGYNYYVYFAGEEKAIGELELEESGGKVSTYNYIIYAFPNSYSKAQKIFALNQDNVMVYMENRHAYGRWKLPLANAAFAQEAENAQNLEGELAKNAVGQDQNYWVEDDSTNY